MPNNATERLFTEENTWFGGFYQLAIELGPPSDERLQNALNAFCDFRGIVAFYLTRELDPEFQAPVQPTLELLANAGGVPGVATLYDGAQVACSLSSIREEEGSDWIVFYIPMGALSRIYDVGGYPFGGGEDCAVWRQPLDQWLMEMGKKVFSSVSFQLGLVGHEVSGQTTADEIHDGGIPEDRWVGILWREKDQANWYPPSTYQADYSF